MLGRLLLTKLSEGCHEVVIVILRLGSLCISALILDSLLHFMNVVFFWREGRRRLFPHNSVSEGVQFVLAALEGGTLDPFALPSSIRLQSSAREVSEGHHQYAFRRELPRRTFPIALRGLFCLLGKFFCDHLIEILHV